MPTTLLPVHVDGAHLKTTDGQRFKAIGVAEFAMFKRFLARDGWNALVKPILAERRALAHAAGYDGPLVARVFRYAASWNDFAVDPWSYPMSAVTEFTQRLGGEGWYVDWTCGDAQAVLPNPDGPRGQQEHLNQFCAALVSCPNALIVQDANEPFKNGIDVSRIRVPKWGTYLTNSGFYYDGPWNTATDGDVINFHPDRSRDMGDTVEKWLGKLFETAVYLRPLRKPLIYDEIMGAADVSSGSRCNSPELWTLAGLALGFLDGIYFHNTLGSNGFSPVVQDCFMGFIRGAKAGMQI